MTNNEFLQSIKDLEKDTLAQNLGIIVTAGYKRKSCGKNAC